ncbi:MAG: hypothetical protein JNM17_13400 [Archangium sp.]|nr:hypothetical protein [Archangium sp.]
MLTLTGPLPAWDIERRRTDPSELISFLGEGLSRLHEVANAERALQLSQQFSFSLATGEGKAIVHRLVRTTLPHLPWTELAIQTVPHVRVLIPDDDIAPVPPHADHDIGHSLFERNLWFALTAARGTAALRIASFARSMQLAAERAGPFFAPHLPLPVVEAERGDVLLFTPLHAHAAQTNREAFTRVSMDLRIAPLAHVRSRSLRTFVPVVVSDASPAMNGLGRESAVASLAKLGGGVVVITERRPQSLEAASASPTVIADRDSRSSPPPPEAA